MSNFAQRKLARIGAHKGKIALRVANLEEQPIVVPSSDDEESNAGLPSAHDDSDEMQEDESPTMPTSDDDTHQADSAHSADEESPTAHDDSDEVQDAEAVPPLEGDDDDEDDEADAVDEENDEDLEPYKMLQFHTGLHILSQTSRSELTVRQQNVYDDILQAWTEHTAKNDNGRLVAPTEYQLVAAALMLEENPHEHPFEWPSVCADETGMGKTVVALLVLCYMSWKYGLPSMCVSPSEDVAQQSLALAVSMGIDRRCMMVYSSSTRGNGILPLKDLTIIFVVESRLQADFKKFGPAYVDPTIGLINEHLPAEHTIAKYVDDAGHSLPGKAARLEKAAKTLGDLRDIRIKADELMQEEMARMEAVLAAGLDPDQGQRKGRACFSSLFPPDMLKATSTDTGGLIECERRFAAIVIDEVHFAASGCGKRGKPNKVFHLRMCTVRKQSLQALRVILRSAHRGFGMSGTPFNNSIMDAMVIFALVVRAPRACMANKMIWRRYEQPEVAEQLRGVGRYRSAIPEIEHVPISVATEEDELIIRSMEQRVIDSLKKQRDANEADSGTGQSHLGDVMSGMTQIQQQVTQISAFKHGLKQEMLKHFAANIAESTPDGPALRPLIITGTYHSQFEMIESMLLEMDRAGEIYQTRSIRVRHYNGKMTTRQRASVLQMYNAGLVDVLILSMKAGQVGLNLQDANPRTMIIVAFPWNPAVLAQVIARGVRPGSQIGISMKVKWVYVENTACAWTRHKIDGKATIGARYFGAESIFNYRNEVGNCRDMKFIRTLRGLVIELSKMTHQRKMVRIQHGIRLAIDDSVAEPSASRSKRQTAAEAAEAAAKLKEEAQKAEAAKAAETEAAEAKAAEAAAAAAIARREAALAAFNQAVADAEAAAAVAARYARPEPGAKRARLE
jgi:hypothetical protein